MVLKCYFDGGNKADSTQYEVVTLAGIFAQQVYWSPFEQEWNAMLKDHEAPPIHVTDVMSSNRDFKGWRQEDRDNLLEDCVTVISRHIALPISGVDRGRFGILPFTVSVVLKDYLRARAIDITVPSHPNEILARQAIGHAFMWGEDYARVPFYEFFFDQNEPFFGYLHDIKNSKHARRDAPLLDRIISNAELDMRQHPGLQMADIYAWAVSHSRRLPLLQWQKRLLALGRRDEWLEGNLLHAAHPNSGRWDTWKIPKRGNPK